MLRRPRTVIKATGNRPDGPPAPSSSVGHSKTCDDQAERVPRGELLAQGRHDICSAAQAR